MAPPISYPHSNSVENTLSSKGIAEALILGRQHDGDAGVQNPASARAAVGLLPFLVEMIVHFSIWAVSNCGLGIDPVFRDSKLDSGLHRASMSYLMSTNEMFDYLNHVDFASLSESQIRCPKWHIS